MAKVKTDIKFTLYNYNYSCGQALMLLFYTKGSHPLNESWYWDEDKLTLDVFILKVMRHTSRSGLISVKCCLRRLVLGL